MNKKIKQGALITALTASSFMTGVFSVPFKHALDKVNAQKEHVQDMRHEIMNDSTYVKAQRDAVGLRILSTDDGDRLYETTRKGMVDAKLTMSDEEYRAGQKKVYNKVETQRVVDQKIKDNVGPEQEKLKELISEATNATLPFAASGLLALSSFIAMGATLVGHQKNANDQGPTMSGNKFRTGQ